MPTPASAPTESARPAARRRAALVLGAVVVAAILVAGLLAEGLVRLAVRHDADGQAWMRSVRLRPYVLPLHQIAETLAALERATSFLAYDPVLGWAPRPGARSADGRRRVDAAGIRTDGETALDGGAGVLRVALFGDSFTFGDEVGQDETWGVALERGLAARGVPAEVLNFGVNAYGTDQAYLRWRSAGRRRHPAVVVLGLQPENVLRNLNVFRPLYFMGSEVPLSKPRFIVQDGALATVNMPTIPVDGLHDALATLDANTLLAHERYFGPYEAHWWLRSRAAALVVTALADARSNPFHLSAEARDLGVRLVDAFAADVQATGAGFVVVHLPRREDIAAELAGQAPWCDALLRTLAARHELIRPETAITRLDDAMFQPHGHYAPALNQVVGAALVEPVLRAAGRR
jgi:hypothetical protein